MARTGGVIPTSWFAAPPLNSNLHKELPRTLLLFALAESFALAAIATTTTGLIGRALL